MKIKKNIWISALILSMPLYAQKFETKGNITLGVTPVEQVLDAKMTDTKTQFGGAYLLGNIAVSNEKLTAAGKIYWRLGATDDIDDLSQKIDIKRAYVRFRPFGNNDLEFSAGKLYSYYLSGNYFQLAEIYTGASRWGKTGFGAKANIKGLTLGLALPLSESYIPFKEQFGLNAAAEFDISSVAENIPMKAGACLLYEKTKDKNDDDEHNLAKMISLTFTPNLDGILSKMSVTLSWSHDAEPFVASSVFKNVTNYKLSDLKKAWFASLNFRSYIGNVLLLAEGEAGHSTSGELVPIYFGAQALVPIINHFALKPRVCYYAAIDTENDDESRHTAEFYPRIQLTFSSWTINAGVDLKWKEIEKDDWKTEWSLPMYAEYKIGK